MSVARASEIILRSGGFIRAAAALGLLAAFALCLAQHAAYAGNVTLQPTTTGSAWTLTWPSSPGTSGYFLQTDGTGITTWAPVTISSLALSGLAAATTTNSIDSGNWAQIWAWGTLSTGTALTLTTSSLTTGNLLTLQNTAAAATSTGKVLIVTNATTGPGHGVYSSITGASNTGYAGYFSNTGTSAANYGLYASTSSSTGYGIYSKGNAYVNGDISVANVTSCGTLGTDSGGKIVCQGTLPLTYISTQTASSSASLQFTNLPTSYTTLFLNCSALMPGTNGSYLKFLVGEGATPTWQTTGHYTVAWSFAGPADFGGDSVTTAQSITNAANSGGLNNTYPVSIKAYIDNVGSSAAYKVIDWREEAALTGPAFYTFAGHSYWNNDTNPITGIQIIPSSGNIASGSCSLYGVNNSGGSQVPLSGVTAAAAANSIDNGSWAQTWRWNTLAGASALSLTSTSVAAASNAQTLLNLSLSGANSTSTQTTYGVQVSNAHTGTSSTNVGLFVSATGGSTNYAIVVPAGSVGIGTTNPDPNSALDVVGQLSNDGNAFIGGGSGDFVEINTNGSSSSAISFKNGGTAILYIPTGTSTGAGNVGIGTTVPAASLDVNGAIATRASSVSLTADNQLVTVTNISFLKITSNNATATNRTFCLKGGVVGQLLIIENMSSNDSELLAAAQPCTGSPDAVTSANGTKQFGNTGDADQLIYDGSTWVELSRSP